MTATKIVNKEDIIKLLNKIELYYKENDLECEPIGTVFTSADHSRNSTKHTVIVLNTDIDVLML